MAEQSVFEKKFVEKNTMDDVEGILENFNLPVGVISFIRRNVLAIKIGIGIAVILTVSYSAYVSYSKSLLQESTTELGMALEQTDTAAQNAAFKAVYEEFGGTDAATWAMANLAHNEIVAQNFAQAAQNYQLLLDNSSEGNAIYPLALFGKASAYEGLSKFDESFSLFEQLQSFSGYRDLGQLGMARSWEARGDISKAIMVYNDYLLTAGASKNNLKTYVEGKIIRLETKLQVK
ncbi:MAG: tetratricopeptide repeat protein [Desulfotalea sp.]